MLFILFWLDCITFCCVSLPSSSNKKVAVSIIDVNLLFFPGIARTHRKFQQHFAGDDAAKPVGDMEEEELKFWMIKLGR